LPYLRNMQGKSRHRIVHCPKK